MKVFLQFIMVERSDGRPILGLLVSRIAEESQVSYTLKTSDIFGMFWFFVIISFYKLSYQVQHSNTYCSATLPPSLSPLSTCLSVRLRITCLSCCFDSKKGITFWNADFGFCNKTGNPKWPFNANNLPSNWLIKGSSWEQFLKGYSRFPKNSERKGNPRTVFVALKSVVGFRNKWQIGNLDFEILIQTFHSTAPFVELSFWFTRLRLKK